MLDWLRHRLGQGFIFSGILLAFWGGFTAYKAVASKNWPTLDARITRSEVIQGTGERRTKCAALVVYAYRAEGKRYEGRNVTFSDSWGDCAEKQQIVDRYPVGEDVEVHADPDDPAYAVLEPGASATSAYSLGVGIVFFLIGVFLRMYFRDSS